jgi:hypothetical protein
MDTGLGGNRPSPDEWVRPRKKGETSCVLVVVIICKRILLYHTLLKVSITTYETLIRT